MKTIKLNEYSESMGILIDVRHPLEYEKGHDPNSINIYYEKLMYNHYKYLDKNKKYFIVCDKGILSTKTVRYLSFLGYDVTNIEK